MATLFWLILLVFTIGLIVSVGIELNSGNSSSSKSEPYKKTILGEELTVEPVNEHAITCPNCQSVKVDFIGNNKKSFSAGKAVGGAVLLGPIGAAAGFAGKKGKKNQWHCKNCGSLFNK